MARRAGAAVVLRRNGVESHRAAEFTVMAWRVAPLLSLLALVPLAIAVFVWALRRRREALQRFADARLLPTLAPDLDVRRQRWRATIAVGALALLVVALAGPKWGFHWEEVR